MIPRQGTPSGAAGLTGPVVLVTGTGTGVGKTVVTAALAAVLARSGPVAIDKPVQTGVCPGEPGDAEEAGRLAGISHAGTGFRLALPMAPLQAARRERVPLPGLSVHAARIAALADRSGTVLVEGAGGLTVGLDEHGHTIADLAHALARQVSGLAGPGRAAGLTPPVPVVVVAEPGLGTLNHIELTLEGLGHRGLSAAGVVLGSWPASPGPVELDNREHLRALPVPLLGAVPLGAPALGPAAFQAAAPGWFPALRTAAGEPENAAPAALRTRPGPAPARA